MSYQLTVDGRPIELELRGFQDGYARFSTSATPPPLRWNLSDKGAEMIATIESTSLRIEQCTIKTLVRRNPIFRRYCDVPETMPLGLSYEADEEEEEDGDDGGELVEAELRLARDYRLHVRMIVYEEVAPHIMKVLLLVPVVSFPDKRFSRGYRLHQIGDEISRGYLLIGAPAKSSSKKKKSRTKAVKKKAKKVIRKVKKAPKRVKKVVKKGIRKITGKKKTKGETPKAEGALKSKERGKIRKAGKKERRGLRKAGKTEEAAAHKAAERQQLKEGKAARATQKKLKRTARKEAEAAAKTTTQQQKAAAAAAKAERPPAAPKGKPAAAAAAAPAEAAPAATPSKPSLPAAGAGGGPSADGGGGAGAGGSGTGGGGGGMPPPSQLQPDLSQQQQQLQPGVPLGPTPGLGPTVAQQQQQQQAGLAATSTGPLQGAIGFGGTAAPTPGAVAGAPGAPSQQSVTQEVKIVVGGGEKQPVSIALNLEFDNDAPDELWEDVLVLPENPEATIAGSLTLGQLRDRTVAVHAREVGAPLHADRVHLLEHRLAETKGSAERAMATSIRWLMSDLVSDSDYDSSSSGSSSSGSLSGDDSD